MATTAPPGKEVRVTRIGDTSGGRAPRRLGALVRAGGAARVAAAPLWHALAWAVFGAGYVAAVVFVSLCACTRSPGKVLLVLAAGSRLSAYIGATVGEIGFLRGIWLDGSIRLAWLEDYAAALDERSDVPVPRALAERHPLRPRLVRLSRHRRVACSRTSAWSSSPASVVAIVGENGAGKTTLVKLLCRLYQPTSGRILVDGRDLARMPVDDWRSRLAGAFQDFFRFEFRARQTCRRWATCRGSTTTHAVVMAVDRAGAGDVVERLAAGLETQLGPTWPDGVEISFGQWQKLALARGFMRDRPLLLVLDEPTAALDAETEHALFERYAAAAQAGQSNGDTGTR